MHAVLSLVNTREYVSEYRRQRTDSIFQNNMSSFDKIITFDAFFGVINRTIFAAELQ